MIWFLLACLAGALAVVAWRSAPMDDPIVCPELPDGNEYGDDLLDWVRKHGNTAPDDLSTLDGA
ncbi:hypothetical protein [Actinophytocola sp.]|uniref:hypothetical protein n=1 Tax=Actinophytocola sp. TaxID=1872138 RepID=UPI002DB8DB1F|nr:hypothetical protein [Actinophytocola sp.]